MSYMKLAAGETDDLMVQLSRLNNVIVPCGEYDRDNNGQYTIKINYLDCTDLCLKFAGNEWWRVINVVEQIRSVINPEIICSLA